MRIVVLVKPVPDATGQERLGPDGRLDRTAAPPVMNGNDEYTLEAALQLAEAVGGDVTLLAMAPAEGLEALRKGLAMGAARAVVVTDDALAGSCALSTSTCSRRRSARSRSTSRWPARTARTAAAASSGPGSRRPSGCRS